MIAFANDPGVIWSPFPGFQRRALAARADEVFIGGAKGPGKTDLLIMKPLYQIDKPTYKALFLRHSFPQLTEVIDRMHRIYGRLPAHQRPAWSGQDERFNFPSGAKVRVGYCHKRAHVERYQGQEWADILYDELGNLPDENVWTDLSSEQRNKSNEVSCQMVGSGNPGFAGHGWIKRRFIIPCGVDGGKISWSKVDVPRLGPTWMSRQFVPGRVTDNPIYANDPRYMARLMLLPERRRRCLMDGDWDAATGMAFDELEPRVHLIPRFDAPNDWTYVAGFDWGFAHWAVFTWGRVSEDGRIFIHDTIKMRHVPDWDMAATILERVPRGALRMVQAGHDLRDTSEGKGDLTPTREKYFHDQGINTTPANIKRAAGYANMLQYMAWKKTPYLPQRQPMVQFFDTPGNRWLVEEHLAQQIVDPEDPSVVLKNDCDDETGEGGDDGCDALRYLLASRPMKAPSHARLIPFTSSDDAILRAMAERVYRPDLTERVTPAPGFKPYMGV